MRLTRKLQLMAEQCGRRMKYVCGGRDQIASCPWMGVYSSEAKCTRSGATDRFPRQKCDSLDRAVVIKTEGDEMKKSDEAAHLSVY